MAKGLQRLLDRKDNAHYGVIHVAVGEEQKMVDRAAWHRAALGAQLTPDLARPVHAVVFTMHLANGFELLTIPACASRAAARVCLAPLVLVVGRRGDRQLGADRLDPVVLAVLVDEADHVGYRRREAGPSSCACAKYADALYKTPTPTNPTGRQ